MIFEHFGIRRARDAFSRDRPSGPSHFASSPFLLLSPSAPPPLHPFISPRLSGKLSPDLDSWPQTHTQNDTLTQALTHTHRLSYRGHRNAHILRCTIAAFCRNLADAHCVFEKTSKGEMLCLKQYFGGIPKNLF